MLFNTVSTRSIVIPPAPDRVRDIFSVTGEDLYSIGGIGMPTQYQVSMLIGQCVTVIRLFEQSIRQRLTGMCPQVESTAAHHLDRFGAGLRTVIGGESSGRDNVASFGEIEGCAIQPLSQHVSE